MTCVEILLTAAQVFLGVGMLVLTIFLMLAARQSARMSKEQTEATVRQTEATCAQTRVAELAVLMEAFRMAAEPIGPNAETLLSGERKIGEILHVELNAILDEIDERKET
ncbi:MAG: hypothetical protein HN463_01315 [Gemmatimonadales bacterium]|jgi:hypothetical protein|nr:hypothetical protein [Gemmatimonadales bacterium]